MHSILKYSLSTINLYFKSAEKENVEKTLAILYVRFVPLKYGTVRGLDDLCTVPFKYVTVHFIIFQQMPNNLGWEIYIKC